MHARTSLYGIALGATLFASPATAQDNILEGGVALAFEAAHDTVAAHPVLATDLDAQGDWAYACGDVSAFGNGFAHVLAYHIKSGALLWGVDFDEGALFDDRARALVAAPDGSAVYVAFETSDPASVGQTSDIVVVAYEAASGNVQWNTRWAGANASHELLNDLVLSPDGSTLVGGGLRGNGDPASNDFFALALDAASGGVQWVRQINAAPLSQDELTELAFDATGARLYATGGAFAGNWDLHTLALDPSNGTTLWSALAVNANWSADRSPSLAVDLAGTQVCVDGHGLLPGDSILYAYDAAAGSPLWTAPFAGWINDLEYDLSGATLAVTGFEYDANFDSSITTRTYDAQSGAAGWTSTYKSAGTIGSHNEDQGLQLRYHPNGAQLYVAGGSTFWNDLDVWSVLSLDATNGNLTSFSELDTTLTGDEFPVAMDLSDDLKHVVIAGLASSGASTPKELFVGSFSSQGSQLQASYVYAGEGSSSDRARALAHAPDGAQLYASSYSFGASANTRLNAFDATTGVELWSVAPSTSSTSNAEVGALAVAPDSARVYMGARSLNDWHVEAFDAVDGASLWAHAPAPTEYTAGIPAALLSEPSGSRVYGAGMLAVTTSKEDFGAIAYDAQTGAVQWASHIDLGSNQEEARAAVLAPSGGVLFLAGETRDANTQEDLGLVALSTANGGLLWSARWDRFGGVGGQFGRESLADLALDSNGQRLFAVGSSFDFFGTATQDAVVVAFDATTGAELWSAIYNGGQGGSEFALAVAAHPTRNEVYVAGYEGLATTPGGANAANLNVRAYDALNGSLLWSTSLPSSGFDQASDLAVDPSGQLVYVCGERQFAPGAASDGVALALDSASGTLRWSARFDGDASGSDRATGLDLDGERARLYVLGEHLQNSTSEDVLIHALDLASLSGLPQAQSLSAGGAQAMQLDAGLAFAGQPYLILGSASGTAPGVPIDGLLLPLNVDGYFVASLNAPSAGPVQQGLGVLDAQGSALTSLVVPPNSPAGLAGVTLHHAGLVLGSTKLEWVSTALATELVP